MEFSDDYNTFQLKPISHHHGVDFSTDFASRRESRTLKRTRSRSMRESGGGREGSRTVKQVTLSVVMVGTLLVAIVLPTLHQPASDPRYENYISVVDRQELVAGTGSRVAAGSAAGDTAEALNSLTAALEMARQQRAGKARKLFLHALALAPQDSRVLLQYGRFLEQSEETVEADHMYTRAAAFSRADTGILREALAGRQRTSNKVELYDNAVLRRIDDKKLEFLQIKSDSQVMKRAKKEAYFQYIYHTVGIEGNTMSLAQTRSILETKLAVGGKSIMEHNEILGMDAALKYINNTLVDKLGDITLEDILQIHQRVLGHAEPGDAGLLRVVQVFVGDHVPPPPDLLAALLDKFVSWLNSPAALALHPVRLAALAHYKLVHIHPWLDGNGRTSRLLMNLVLMQAGFPPVIIRRADREVYYRHLVTANEGDIRPFVRFIAHCTENTLDAYLWASTEYPGPDPARLPGTAELPHNLLEHSLHQVNTDLLQYRDSRGGPAWLNLQPGQEAGQAAAGQEEEEEVAIRLDPVQ